MGELYNFSDDLGENSNLIQRKPELATELLKKIHACLTQQYPTWGPKYPLNKSVGKPVGPPPSLKL